MWWLGAGGEGWLLPSQCGTAAVETPVVPDNIDLYTIQYDAYIMCPALLICHPLLVFLSPTLPCRGHLSTQNKCHDAIIGQQLTTISWFWPTWIQKKMLQVLVTTILHSPRDLILQSMQTCSAQLLFLHKIILFCIFGGPVICILRHSSLFVSSFEGGREFWWSMGSTLHFPYFLNALASLDFKLSLTESVSDSPFPNFQIINDNKW